MWLPVVMTWCAEIEELFGDGGRDAESAGSVFAVDDEQVDGVRFQHVREVLAHDVAAGGTEDVADEENIHLWSLAGIWTSWLKRG